MNPNDFMNAAQLLCSQSSEDCHRSAVSRAYYSIYLSLRAEVISQLNNITLGGASLGKNQDIAHTKLAKCLQLCPPTQSIGDKLLQLLAARHTADYHMNHFVDRQYAADKISDAQGLKTKIDTFSYSPASGAPSTKSASGNLNATAGSTINGSKAVIAALKDHLVPLYGQ